MSDIEVTIFGNAFPVTEARMQQASATLALAQCWDELTDSEREILHRAQVILDAILKDKR